MTTAKRIKKQMAEKDVDGAGNALPASAAAYTNNGSNF
jgi:hypothetical protein